MKRKRSLRERGKNNGKSPGSVRTGKGRYEPPPYPFRRVLAHLRSPSIISAPFPSGVCSPHLLHWKQLPEQAHLLGLHQTKQRCFPAFPLFPSIIHSRPQSRRLYPQGWRVTVFSSPVPAVMWISDWG